MTNLRRKVRVPVQFDRRPATPYGGLTGVRKIHQIAPESTVWPHLIPVRFLSAPPPLSSSSSPSRSPTTTAAAGDFAAAPLDSGEPPSPGSLSFCAPLFANPSRRRPASSRRPSPPLAACSIHLATAARRATVPPSLRQATLSLPILAPLHLTLTSRVPVTRALRRFTVNLELRDRHPPSSSSTSPFEIADSPFVSFARARLRSVGRRHPFGPGSSSTDSVTLVRSVLVEKSLSS